MIYTAEQFDQLLAKLDSEQQQVEQWLEDLRNAPSVRGRGGELIPVSITDPAGVDADLDELRREACARVRLSFVSPDATYNLGVTSLKSSNHSITTRTMLESLGKRALKATFTRSQEGRIYLRLVEKIKVRSTSGGTPPGTGSI